MSLYVFANGNKFGIGGNPNNSPKSLYRITALWQEGTISWTRQPAFNATAITRNTNASINVWEDYIVTTAVKDIVENKVANHGFMLKFPTENDYRGARIYSSEATAVSMRPKLVVTYTPPTVGVRQRAERVTGNGAGAVTFVSVQGRTVGRNAGGNARGERTFCTGAYVAQPSIGSVSRKVVLTDR